ncbi:hypothetical protein F1734_26010 (plasmid) [Rhodococcus ruber]|uniref:hypothetical protein n=1 Tax=Rhodococcus ruber TaxID=1830 RepID=UPI001122874C|nr:hypothetical protein [Rhodococcus ruber]QDC17465.1 hypothetical protein E2561_25090 [Rhodococcus ruber]QRE83795.1 hypothetical protein F1734_26010 [Rhodococcus ruber]
MTMTEQWDRLLTWCDRFAPLTRHAVRPPVGEATLKAAQAAAPAPWPDELRRFFALQGGTYTHTRSGVDLGTLLPQTTLLSLDEALAAPTPAARTRPDTVAAGHRRATPPAQCREDTDAPPPIACVPFAAGADHHLVVVTEPGPHRGAVIEYRPGGAPTRPARWDSLAHLLAELVSSLHHHTPFARWHPIPADRKLTWSTHPPPSAA